MKFINAFRYIRGVVSFEAKGGFSERFINLCRVNGVRIWDIKEDEGAIIAKTTIDGYRKIPLVTRKSGMKIKIIKKSGLPFIFKAFSARKGLILGIITSVFLLMLYSKSIWSIRVTGNKNIPAEQIISVLEENGLRKGTFKKDIDYDVYKYLLFKNIPEISWANLQIDGSEMTVEVTEVTPIPESREKNICNIVASYDGVIDRMVVSAGESRVQPGEAVKKGDLLVSGVTYNDKANVTQFWASRAEIIASTERNIKIEVAKNQAKTVFTGEKKQVDELELFRLRLPLYLFDMPFESYETEESEEKLIFFGKELPIKISHKTAKETRIERYTADEKIAEALAAPQKTAYEERLPEDSQIKTIKKTIKETEDSFIFIYTYYLTENIAEELPINLDNK